MNRTPLEIKKHSKGLCCESHCKNQHAIGWRCNYHAKAISIKNDPLRYSFQTLKRNAKRRGKDFTLTLDEFKLFAEKTDYMRKKGITAKSLQIDRIDEYKGYHFDNIQAITLRENRYKYSKKMKEIRESTPF